MLTRALLVSVAIFGCTSGALAADLPVKAAPRLTLVDEYNWTGFYAGGFVGGAWGRTNDFAFVGGPTRLNPKGIFAGVHAGYDMQLSNRVVLGVRAAVPFGISFDDTVTSAVAPATAKARIQWATFFTGHLGLAMGRWLPYVGGGLALGEGKATFTSPAGAVSTDSNFHVGYTVLTGIRYALSPLWWVALQYNYADFGSKNYTLGFASPSIDFRSHSVTGILSYRFGQR